MERDPPLRPFTEQFLVTSPHWPGHRAGQFLLRTPMRRAIIVGLVPPVHTAIPVRLQTGDEHMRIAAMAAGAVGGYFGARHGGGGPRCLLHCARRPPRRHREERPQDRERARRSCICRSPTSPMIRRRSVRSTSCCSRSSCGTPKRRPAAARPLLGPDSRLITFQNGVDSVERIAAVLGADRVIGGAAYIATVIASPGVIKHTSEFRDDAFRARRQEARRHAQGVCGCRQSGEARHRSVGRHPA